jgi:hypothetical protein
MLYGGAKGLVMTVIQERLETELISTYDELVETRAALAQVIIPHHETFSTTIHHPYSSTKG